MFGLFADAVVSSNGRRRKLEDKSDCLLSSVLGGTIQCACNRSADEVFLENVLRQCVKGPWIKKSCSRSAIGEAVTLLRAGSRSASQDSVLHIIVTMSRLRRYQIKPQPSLLPLLLLLLLSLLLSRLTLLFFFFFLRLLLRSLL